MKLQLEEQKQQLRATKAFDIVELQEELGKDRKQINDMQAFDARRRRHMKQVGVALLKERADMRQRAALWTG
eukprot:gene12430-biopygen10766